MPVPRVLGRLALHTRLAFRTRRGSVDLHVGAESGGSAGIHDRAARVGVGVWAYNPLLQHFGWQIAIYHLAFWLEFGLPYKPSWNLTKLANVQPHLDIEKLLREDWRKMNGARKESPSQELGRAVADLAEGILTPSRIRTGKNLVIYPRNLKPESRIEVLGKRDLPT
jgi:hypothetical protein